MLDSILSEHVLSFPKLCPLHISPPVVITGGLLFHNAPLPSNGQWCTSERRSRRRGGNVNRACGGGGAAAAVLHNIRQTQLCLSVV